MLPIVGSMKSTDTQASLPSSDSPLPGSRVPLDRPAPAILASLWLLNSFQTQDIYRCCFLYLGPSAPLSSWLALCPSDPGFNLTLSVEVLWALSAILLWCRSNATSFLAVIIHIYFLACLLVYSLFHHAIVNSACLLCGLSWNCKPHRAGNMSFLLTHK